MAGEKVPIFSGTVAIKCNFNKISLKRSLSDNHQPESSCTLNSSATNAHAYQRNRVVASHRVNSENCALNFSKVSSVVLKPLWHDHDDVFEDSSAASNHCTTLLDILRQPSWVCIPSPVP